jgi:hypothetical protein
MRVPPVQPTEGPTVTFPISDPDTLAIRDAARRFTRALAAEAMLEATARIEARLVAGGAAGSLFALDEALAAAWRRTECALPRHEVIWAPGDGDREGLRLSAFDAAGRVLLRRSYAAGPARKSLGHV